MAPTRWLCWPPSFLPPVTCTVLRTTHNKVLLRSGGGGDTVVYCEEIITCLLFLTYNLKKRKEFPFCGINKVSSYLKIVIYVHCKLYWLVWTWRRLKPMSTSVPVNSLNVCLFLNGTRTTLSAQLYFCSHVCLCARKSKFWFQFGLISNLARHRLEQFLNQRVEIGAVTSCLLQANEIRKELPS